jgi:hypothetical protein
MPRPGCAICGSRERPSVIIGPLRPQSTGDLLSSAIREGDLKLIDFPQEQRTELYDLANDGDESNDLAAQRPADTARLLTKLNTWKQGLTP